jgi:ribonuclease D
MSTMLVEHADDTLPLQTFEGDLDERAFERALGVSALAWDIETSGLDWRTDKIGTVQVQIDGLICVVRINGRLPHRLKALMEDPTILKVLHHAMFDLRFLAYHWDVTPARVACTKIASKLADPQIPCKEHSLAILARRYLGVELDKGPQTSDWTDELTPAQLRYAANDVRYLWQLYERLDERIRHEGLLDLRERCYAHLRTRVELEIGGFPDVFEY